MSNLVAITFAGEDDALAALGSVRLLEKEGRIGLEDTAAVSKDADGKIRVKNELSSGTETGAVVGAVLGSLLWVVFPVGAIVGGAIAGGLVGRAVAPGIDGDFVKEIEAGLAPGGSALFLLVKDGDPGLLIAAMRQYQGTVVQTSLDEEEEAALRQSLQ
jgi:uncharacterized membrane protein